MKKTMIIRLSVQETKVTQFLEMTEVMIGKSTEEKGCLTYKLFEETNKANNFLIYEKYENEKAIEEHNASAHFKEYVAAVMSLLIKEPIVEVF